MNASSAVGFIYGLALTIFLYDAGRDRQDAARADTFGPAV